MHEQTFVANVLALPARVRTLKGRKLVGLPAPFKFGPALLQLALFEVGHAQVHVGIGKTRLQLNRSLVITYTFTEAAEVGADKPQRVIDFGVVRIVFEGDQEFGFGFLPAI